MTNLNLAQAQENMISQQFRTWDILNDSILTLYKQILREDFVPKNYCELAYSDMEIPIGAQQQMLAPKIEARMLQALGIKKTDKILEIGTGNGFFTALLASLGKQVFSLEISAELIEQAKKNIKLYSFDNIDIHHANAFDSETLLEQQGYFQVIVLTGSIPVMFKQFKHHLAVGGRLLAIIGEPPVMSATLATRISEKSWQDQVLFETCIPALEQIPYEKPFYL